MLIVLAALTLFQGEAHAWYGPICYSDRTTQLTLTIPSISGENPGDLKVDFDDNDGKVKLGGVRASTAVKNAHEVLLVREAESQNGIFAVIVTSPRSTTGYKFELEFRKDASDCTGAIIKATDRAGALASEGVRLASAHLKPRAVRASKPKKPSPPPAEENAATPVQVVNLNEDAKVPTGVSDTGEAQKADTPAGEAPQSEVPKSEPESKTQPHEAGSEAPAVPPAASGATGISAPVQ